VEGHGVTEEQMWDIMFKSRVVDDMQVRIAKPFVCRGTKELEKKLPSLPWTAYMPKDGASKFKLPQTRAKMHKSTMNNT
jgi:hypothetical protein